MSRFDREESYDDLEDEAGFGIVLSDTFISFYAVTFIILSLMMMLPHFQKTEQALSTMGMLCVEISWPDRNIDMDLWGHSPGDPDTVGFTNMHGETLNLLKDITNNNETANPNHQMMEIQCADKLVPGEWTFNVQYFANHETALDKTKIDDPRKTVEVTMVVRTKMSGKHHAYTDGRDSFMGKFTFTKEKQEKTMFDFVIDKEGNILHNSINSKDKGLINGWKE